MVILGGVEIMDSSIEHAVVLIIVASKYNRHISYIQNIYTPNLFYSHPTLFLAVWSFAVQSIIRDRREKTSSCLN